MYLQDSNAIQLGADIQRQIVVHMARYDKVLSFAIKVMDLDSFSWDVASIVASVLYRYHQKYNRRPPFEILKEEVKTSLKTYGQGFLHETSLPHLLQLLETIRSEPDEGLDESWACDAIKAYCVKYRLANLAEKVSVVLQTGVGAEEALSQAASLSGGISVDEDSLEVSSLVDSSELATSAAGRKISTGLTPMDAAIGGGLEPGELCMLMALQGVGKTNLGLNFLVSAAYDGLYNLFFSLEMPRQALQERVLAMTSHVKAIRFRKVGLAGMDPEEKERIRQVGESDLSSRLVVADYSKTSCTVDNIIEFTGKWLKSLEQRGLRDKVGFVCIDYMNYIEVPGLKGDRTNLSPDVIKRTTDRLKKELANRYGIAAIVISQTTRDAEGSTVLGRKHVAWGFHANDAIDFGFGLAPKEDTRYKSASNDSGQPVDDITEKGRLLVMSSFKARVGNETAFTFYQAPTLRVYDNQKAYKDEEMAMLSEGFHPLPPSLDKNKEA